LSKDPSPGEFKADAHVLAPTTLWEPCGAAFVRLRLKLVDRDLLNRIETAMAPEGALENLRSVDSRAAENAAGIAGVRTIIENPEATIIEGEAMTSACELAAWYVPEAPRLPKRIGFRRACAMRSGGSIGFSGGQA
jgi:Protein of unknown function (DUF3987)